MSEHSSFAFPWFRGCGLSIRSVCVFPRPSATQGPHLAYSRQPKSFPLSLFPGKASSSSLGSETREMWPLLGPLWALWGLREGPQDMGVCVPSQLVHDLGVVIPGLAQDAHTLTQSHAVAFIPSAFISHSSVPGPVLRTQELDLAVLGGSLH